MRASSRNALIPSSMASTTPAALFPTSMVCRPKLSIFRRPQTSWFVSEMTPACRAMPESRTWSRRTERQKEWKVWTATSAPAASSAIRSAISCAAFSEKVRARMDAGSTPLSRRWPTFSVMTRVLPDPGPARISWMPDDLTASAWLGLSCID